MPRKTRSLRFNMLGSKGIRNDVMPELAGEQVVQDLRGFNPGMPNGVLTRESGMTILFQKLFTNTGAVPSMRNLLAMETAEKELLVWSGSSEMIGDVGTIKVGYAHRGIGASVWNEVSAQREIVGDAGTLSHPVQVGERALVPLGPTAPPYLVYRAPEELDGDRTYTERWASLGYPPISCDERDTFHCPVLYVPNNNNDGQTALTLYYATHRYGGAVGFGGDGSTFTAATGTESCRVSDYEWNYAFANCANDDTGVPGSYVKGRGWGYLGGGDQDNVWELKSFALGYVYVYEDGTMSEPSVMVWENQDVSDLSVVGGGVVPCFFGHETNQTDIPSTEEELIIAFRGQIQISKDIIDREKRILGVRVFYTHRSSQGRSGTGWESGEVGEVTANGYCGWIDEVDIFTHMREVYYDNDDDRAYGYCRMENATQQLVEPFDQGTEDNVYRFASFLCPCEYTLEYTPAIREISGDPSASATPRINKPLTLGVKWGAIRGDLADGNGVILRMPTHDDTADALCTSPVVRVYERGKIVWESTPIADSAFSSWDTEHRWTYLPSGTKEFIRGRVDTYTCGAELLEQVNGRVVAARVKFTHTLGDDIDKTTLYVSHIAPDGVSYSYSFPTALAIPIANGEITAMAAARDILLVGTSSTVYAVSISGDPSTWTAMDLHAQSGVPGPRAMIGVDNSVYWIGKDGHVYVFESGSLADRKRGSFTAVRLTDPLDVPNNPAINAPESDAVIAYDKEGDCIIAQVVNGFIRDTHTDNGLAILVSHSNRALGWSYKVFVGGRGSIRGNSVVTTGDWAMSLTTDAKIYTHVEENPTGLFDLMGEIDETDDDIGYYVVDDLDLYVDECGWTETPRQANNPLTRPTYVEALFEVDPDDTILSSRYGRPCVILYGPRLISAYDGDYDVVVPKAGRVTVGAALFEVFEFGAKDTSCSPEYPTVWRTFPRSSDIESHTSSEIQFLIEKEIGLAPPGHRVRIEGVEIGMDFGTGTNTQSVAIEISDPSGRTEFATRTLTFTTGSVLRNKGIVRIPCRAVSNRIKVKIYGSGGVSKSLAFRYLSVDVSVDGKTKLS